LALPEASETSELVTPKPQIDKVFVTDVEQFFSKNRVGPVDVFALGKTARKREAKLLADSGLPKLGVAKGKPTCAEPKPRGRPKKDPSSTKAKRKAPTKAKPKASTKKQKIDGCSAATQGNPKNILDGIPEELLPVKPLAEGRTNYTVSHSSGASVHVMLTKKSFYVYKLPDKYSSEYDGSRTINWNLWGGSAAAAWDQLRHRIGWK
jgi:hypothetical protein